ncbi:MAG: hypothetical protein JEY99_09750 [Spirochaetales bacterium]|nr:hypothetical protein [Spirochaetales bacterium]
MNKYIAVTFMVLSLISTGLTAEEYIISDIVITGNTRTRDNTILDIINVTQGETADEKKVEEVKQKLLASGIFQSNLNVNLNIISGKEGVLTIELMDRWTLLPLPAGFVSSDKWLAGAVFIESNLAGLNQLLVAGAFISDDNIFGFSAWNNPAFMGTEYSLGVSLSGDDGKKEHLDVTGENILASIDQTMVSASIRLGRTYSSGFGWRGSTGIMSFKYGEGTGYFAESSESNMYWKNGLDLSWNNLFYISFFNEGASIHLKNTLYSEFTTMKTEPVFQLDLSHNFIIADRHLFRGNIKAGWQNRTDSTPLFLGGREGSRALPSGDVAVKRYVSGALTFEPVIFKPDWGIFTLPVYYEAGLFQPLKEEFPVSWNGPGIGFRFYVDKVAIPALGADFTWNINERTFKVVVSVGGSGGE